MITVLTVVGTRPEAIKMAPVISELARHPNAIRSVVCATGQHREMLKQTLQQFDIIPDHELDVMQPNQRLADLTARLFSGLDGVIGALDPDWVLAQGDTTTTFVAAMTSFYRARRFGHVEAGLRTDDRRNPFPEEVNRRLTDVVADAFFAPTERARDALLAEGHDARAIYVTGNTVIDALLSVSAKPCAIEMLLPTVPFDRRLILITAHRRESFGQPFREMCCGLRDLALSLADQNIHCIFPVHLNPNVQEPVRAILHDVPNLTLLKPLDYFTLVHLMKRVELILTDSGGIQEEAPSLSIPVLVMRETTERPEGIDAGVARLVGTDPRRIVMEATRLLTDRKAYAAMASGRNPYGDGNAASRIVSTILGIATPEATAA